MKIVKLREDISRMSENNINVESINHVVYTITDDEGNTIGEAHASVDPFDISLNVSAPSIAAATDTIKQLLNINSNN